MYKSLPLIAGAIFAVSATAGQPVAVWEFDDGRQGWAIVTLSSSNPGGTPIPYMADWFSTGGNPGGCISETDPDSQSFYFASPFVGNASAAYGSDLLFDLRITLDNTDFDTDIILTGAGITVYRGIDDPTLGVWSSYAVVLRETGDWLKADGTSVSRTEFMSVLSSLDAIYIRGEYSTGTDQARMDNAVLGSPRCMSDTDDDEDVDIDDVQLFFSCMNGPAVALDSVCTLTDIDLDSDADLADFAQLQVDFGGVCP